MSGPTFLDALTTAAANADAAEADFRKQFDSRIKALEQERAFAYRRLNLMRAVANAIAPAKDEEQAVAIARATLRSSVGWEDDSETRIEALTRFAPVSRAAFASLAPPEAEADEADVPQALVEFEAWYLTARGQPFWTLFEQYIPELPLVER
jgi:hypothetical protein